ncbi:hypothetical protein B0O99DRAFT_99976 [Bisporella sp. PMI_857]|nr:hypothetical protein B0O99DRAFT_99976 [Bisporella sp. PMI_857]
MASTEKANLPSNAPRVPDRPGMTIRTSSSNYVTAQQAAEAAKSPSSAVSIPDGRRNSVGEVLKSPTEAWRPDFKRKQSYNQEDLKRELQMSSVVKDDPKGFSEK